MGSYEDAVRTLEVELRVVEQAFRDLTTSSGRRRRSSSRSTRPNPTGRYSSWSGTSTISIGLTVLLMAEPQAGQVGRDRTSFFIFPRSEVAPGQDPRADARRPP
jgi:hypothetical protein